MNTETGQLIEAITQAFAQAAPDDWVEINVEIQSLTELTDIQASATMESGEEQSYFIADIGLQESAYDNIVKLRRVMAALNGDRGAWFTMTLAIDSTGKYSAGFDYDNKPDFGYEPSDESLLDDLETFPRSPEFYPEWAQGLSRHTD